MSEYKQGDIVVLEHPHLYDAHSLARIAAPPTKATVMVVYWLPLRKDWSDEPRRRKTSAIVGRVSGEVSKTWERLKSTQAELGASLKRARASYLRTVTALVEYDAWPQTPTPIKKATPDA